VLAFGLAALTSGCFSLDGQFEVAKDDTVSGTIVVTLADKTVDALVKRSKLDAKEVVNQLKAEVEASAKEAFQGSVEVSEHDADGYQGFQVTLEQVALSNFSSGQDGTLALTHSDGEFSLTGELDVASFTHAMLAFYDDSDGSLKAALADVKPTVSFKFPGRVLTTSGTAKGHTATFALSLDGPTPIEATAKDSTPIWWLIAAVAQFVGAAAVAAVALLRLELRRKRHSPKEDQQCPSPMP
jgi:hypothetical protein